MSETSSTHFLTLRIATPYIMRAFVFLLIFCFYCHLGATARNARQERILLIVDASIAMVDTMPDGQTKYQHTVQLINKLMDSMYATDSDIAIAMRVFGHQSLLADNNCKDSKLEVHYSNDNRTQIMLRLASLHPRGMNAAAYALGQAAFDLGDTLRYRHTIIFISSGERYCGGGLCEAAERLKANTNADSYVLTISADGHASDVYQCVGNSYMPITGEALADHAVAIICRKFRRKKNAVAEWPSTPVRTQLPIEQPVLKPAPKDSIAVISPTERPTYLFINTVYTIANIKVKYRLTEEKPFQDISVSIALLVGSAMAWNISRLVFFMLCNHSFANICATIYLRKYLVAHF